MNRAAVFVIVGAVGFVVQIATLAALTAGAGWHWLPATIVAVEVAVVHNFLWHERWTWCDRATSGARAVAVRLIKFTGGNGLTSIAGNAGLMALLAGALRLPPVAASALSVIVLALVNFAIADRWVFSTDSRPRHREAARPAESDGRWTERARSRPRRCGWLPDRYAHRQ